MTAARPYRMTPLTPEQALTELRKFAGIQFDPMVVDAFVRTAWVDGIIETGKPPELRAIPTIGRVAERMTDRMTKPTTVAKPRPRPRAQADLISATPKVFNREPGPARAEASDAGGIQACAPQAIQAKK